LDFVLFLRLLRSSDDEELLELSSELSEDVESLSDSEELSLESELLLAARFDFLACFLLFSTESFLFFS